MYKVLFVITFNTLRIESNDNTKALRLQRMQNMFDLRNKLWGTKLKAKIGNG